MSRSTGFQHTLPDLLPSRPTGDLPRSALLNWEAPTFAEFVSRIEHEFGDAVDLSALGPAQADRDEPLSPASVRSLCELLGVPPEDLGV